MNVQPPRVPEGASKKKTVLGRGRSSGKGKTCGRGHKGQKSRSGGGVRLGFEGGQMPIYRRVASRGFSNHPFKKDFAVINLSALEKFYNNGDTVSLSTIVQKGLVKKSEHLIKILGTGELTKKLNVAVPYISSSARIKIEEIGGTVIIVKKEGKRWQVIP